MPDAADDNTAPMSQDDIDAMLGGDQEDSGDQPEAGAGSSGPLSQADIDAALGDAQPGDASASQADPVAPDSQDDSDAAAAGAGDQGPLSQDDIDAALAGAGAESAPDGDAAGALDQNETDAVLAGGGGGEAPLDDTGGSLSQADIDAALSEAGIATGLPEVPAVPAAPAATMPPPTLSGNVVQGGDLQSFDLPDLQASHAAALANVASIEMLRDVDLNVKIELGRSRMLVEDVLKLDSGAVVELDKLAGDPVEVFVNEQLVARGEVLVLNDNFCVRINEIVAPLSEMKTA